MTMSGGSLCAGTCRLTNGSFATAGHFRRGGGCNPPAPGLRADGVADLPQVGAGQERGEHLEEPQQQPAGGARRARDGWRRSSPARRPGRRRTGRCSTPSTGGHGRSTGGSPGARPGSPTTRPATPAIVLCSVTPSSRSTHRHDRGQHRGARQREREPPGGGPRPGRPAAVPGPDEQRGRAQRRGQDPGQHERS